MVSLTEIRNRLQPSFTADQAELIANLHVEMHDQLVTPHDFAELRRVVEQLADSQQHLAEAQQRTEKHVGELAESQQQLAEAQKRTDQRVGELAEAQGRTEQRVGQLAEAQEQTEHTVANLATSVTRLEYAVKDLAKQVGGLAATAGSNLEAYASERIPEVLAERFGFVMESCGSESIAVGEKSYEFDAVLRGTIDGRPVVVLCEVKTNISESEVRGFLRIVDCLRTTVAKEAGGAKVRPLFFGYRAAGVTQKLATGSGAWLVFPRGLVAAA
jgi:DNA repair ATPase RecN